MGNNVFIKQHREAAGLTQTALAGEVGVSKAQLSRIESGSRRVHTILLSKIALALAIKPEALWVNPAEAHTP